MATNMLPSPGTPARGTGPHPTTLGELGSPSLLFLPTHLMEKYILSQLWKSQVGERPDWVPGVSYGL